MFFYIVFFIGIGLSFVSNQERSSKIYACLLAVIAIFRYGIGPDYFSYKFLFERLSPNVIHEITSGLDHHELGFRIIGSTFKMFGLNYQIYVSFFAIVSLSFIYKIVEKYSKNPTFSLTIFYSIYYFVWVFSSLRQGTALSIGIYFLLEAIKEKKVKPFIIVTLLLTMIHTSAAILLLFYLFSKLKVDRKKMFIITSISLGFSIIPFGNIVSQLAQYIPVFKRMTSYIVTSQTLTNILDFQTLGRLFFLAIAFVFYNQFKENFPDDSFLVDLYIFSFILYFFLKFSELTAARIAIYGKLLEVLILTNFLYMEHVTRKQIIALCLLISIIFAYLYKELNTMERNGGLIDNNPFTTPYVNIFNGNQFLFDSKYDFMNR